MVVDFESDDEYAFYVNSEDECKYLMGCHQTIYLRPHKSSEISKIRKRLIETAATKEGSFLICEWRDKKTDEDFCCIAYIVKE